MHKTSILSFKKYKNTASAQLWTTEYRETQVPFAEHRKPHDNFALPAPPTFEQSWALEVFFNFFNNKKWFFCIFYQANLTRSGLFK